MVLPASGRRFDELTDPEIAAALARSPRVILPMGSVEQHGPHLPTGTDFFAATAIALQVAERIDALVLPLCPLGVTPMHMPFPGTVSLRPQTLQDVVTDIASSLAAPKGKTEGMCAFLVEKNSEGFEASPIKNKLGLPTSDTGLLYFSDCKVPKENMLGPIGKGLSVAYTALMSGRLSVAAGCVGVAQDCLNEAVRYAQERVQHKKKIGKHQLVQREIAKISVDLEASRLLTYRAALLKAKSDAKPNDTGLRNEADWMIAQAKYCAANVSFRSADRAVQVFGANGFSFENRPARHLVDTRVCRIYEGTDQILEQKIAVKLLGNEYEAFS